MKLTKLKKKAKKHAEHEKQRRKVREEMLKIGVLQELRVRERRLLEIATEFMLVAGVNWDGLHEVTQHLQKLPQSEVRRRLGYLRAPVAPPIVDRPVFLDEPFVSSRGIGIPGVASETTPPGVFGAAADGGTTGETSGVGFPGVAAGTTWAGASGASAGGATGESLGGGYVSVWLGPPGGAEFGYALAEGSTGDVSYGTAAAMPLANDGAHTAGAAFVVPGTQGGSFSGMPGAAAPDALAGPALQDLPPRVRQQVQAWARNFYSLWPCADD